MKRVASIGLTVMLMAASQAAWAHGDVCCNTPKSERQPRVDLQKKLKKMGWTVRDIKILNGCYEVHGFDGKNAKVEAFFDPKTFERVRETPPKPSASGK